MEENSTEGSTSESPPSPSSDENEPPKKKPKHNMPPPAPPPSPEKQGDDDSEQEDNMPPPAPPPSPVEEEPVDIMHSSQHDTTVLDIVPTNLNAEFEYEELTIKHPQCAICYNSIKALKQGEDDPSKIVRVKHDGVQEHDAIVFRIDPAEDPKDNRSFEESDSVKSFDIDGPYNAYCRECIEKWIEEKPQNPTDPTTRGRILGVPFPPPFDKRCFIAGILNSQGAVRFWYADGEYYDMVAFEPNVDQLGIAVIAVSDNNEYIAIKGTRNKLVIMNVTTRKKWNFPPITNGDSDRTDDMAVVSFIGNDKLAIGDLNGWITMYHAIQSDSGVEWKEKPIGRWQADIGGCVDSIARIGTDEIVTASDNGTIEIWNISNVSSGNRPRSTQKFIAYETTWHGWSGPEFVKMCVNGSRIFVGFSRNNNDSTTMDKGEVQIWEKNNNVNRLVWGKDDNAVVDYIYDIAISDNGNRLFVLFSLNRIQVWDVGGNTTKLEKTFDVSPLFAQTDATIESIGCCGEYVIVSGSDVVVQGRPKRGKIVVMNVATESPVISRVVGSSMCEWISGATMCFLPPMSGGGGGKQKPRRVKKSKTRRKRRMSKRRK